MPPSEQTQTPNLPRPRVERLKVGVACHTCRSRKIKCDGARPACGNCQKKERLRVSCSYHPAAPNRRPHQGTGSASTLPRASAPEAQPTAHGLPVGSSGRYVEDQGESRNDYSTGTPGIFAGEVNAAIDARLGLPSGGRLNLIPMTDAPLFRSFSRPEIVDTSDPQLDNVLPPRKHADRLLDLYWRCLYPLEPFIGQERFSRSYRALFAGDSLEVDERVFMSTLNVVFALSTQLQESTPVQQREEASNTYFRRAWTLLRPEVAIWEPGSLEIVQCLLLMSRFLQCTDNIQQTWMTGASAVRMAQSLGLHIDDPSSREHRLRRQIWHCCVFIDRGMSWVLGRASIASLHGSPVDVNISDMNVEGQGGDEKSSIYLAKTLELYEIANHLMLSQASSSVSSLDWLGVPRLHQHEEYLTTAVQLDHCITKWEKGLPSLFKSDIFGDRVDDVWNRQRFFLRLRLLHSRIFLFRPMLARLCSSQSHEATDGVVEQGLGDRVARDCASICVENACKIVALVDEQLKQQDGINVVPWWHRIFYLYITGTILLVTMLRPDLFTSTESQHWNRLMLLLRAHEHLSPFVQQCVANFESISQTIAGSHRADGGPMPTAEGSSNTYIKDMFEDLRFDPDNLFFDMEDMSWLNN